MVEENIPGIYSIISSSSNKRQGLKAEIEYIVNNKVAELNQIKEAALAALSASEGVIQENIDARLDEGSVLHEDLKKRLASDYNKLASQFKENVYYDEIVYDKYRDSISSTDYYITYIPNLDKNGKLIKLNHGYQNDIMNSGIGETVRSFSNRNVTSLAVNASIWTVETGLIKGVQIQDGVIKQDVEGGTSYTLGIKEDNTLVMYPPTITAPNILADGCTNAITGFFPMIENSIAVNPAIYNVIGNPALPNPRNVIAQLPNKDILFLTCEGRTSTNLGMTYDDVIRILLARGVKTAYCLDGGGSTQTTVRGLLINNPLDDDGKTERKVADFLYITRPAENKQNFKTVSIDIGNINKKLSDVARDIFDANEDIIAMSADLLGLNRLSIISANISDLNTLNKSNLYWCSGTAANAPTTASSWGVLHYQAGSASALQIAFPYHGTTGAIMLRRTNGDMATWTAWREMTFNKNADNIFLGNIEFGDTAKGIIMKSPDGSRFKFSIDNNGIITTTKL